MLGKVKSIMHKQKGHMQKIVQRRMRKEAHAKKHKRRSTCGKAQARAEKKTRRSKHGEFDINLPLPFLKLNSSKNRK